jgi:hypothetical protein
MFARPEPAAIYQPAPVPYVDETGPQILAWPPRASQESQNSHESMPTPWPMTALSGSTTSLGPRSAAPSQSSWSAEGSLPPAAQWIPTAVSAASASYPVPLSYHPFQPQFLHARPTPSGYDQSQRHLGVVQLPPIHDRDYPHHAPFGQIPSPTRSEFSTSEASAPLYPAAYHNVHDHSQRALPVPRPSAQSVPVPFPPQTPPYPGQQMLHRDITPPYPGGPRGTLIQPPLTPPYPGREQAAHVPATPTNVPLTPPYPGAPLRQHTLDGSTTFPSSSITSPYAEHAETPQEDTTPEPAMQSKPVYIRTLVGPLATNAVRMRDENDVSARFYG